MLLRKKNHTSGFTLIELAIVLGVAGILFGGLWRLFSTGNQQVRDQATANQQSQLISAISTYLQSAQADKWFWPTVTGATPAPLTLPTTAACPGTPGTDPFRMCSYLPSGFTANTVNPYGQIYNIGVVGDGGQPAQLPQFYSFMILTSGGDTIPDTSGGRISATIGGDGGFVYSSNVCGGPFASTACGSYGTWNTSLSTFFAAAAGGSGDVASRTYYSPVQSLSNIWLARIAVPGDTTFSYNTMATSLYMNSAAGASGQNYVYTSPFGTTGIAGVGVINMQGGEINMSSDVTYKCTGGNRCSNTGNAGTIYLGTSGQVFGEYNNSGGAGPGGGSINLDGWMKQTGGVTPNSVLNILEGSGCHLTDPSLAATVCNYLVSVNGSMTVSDLLYANSLYAGQFVYYSSDQRLKKNIKNLNDSLDGIMKLRPVSYTLKVNNKETMGVIAQEIEKVYPELVSEGSDGMKAVSYDGLIAPLIGAVQELKKENDALSAQVKDMQKEIQELKR